MTQATISKVRPVSWRVSVQGKEAAEYVRAMLSDKNIHTTRCHRDPDLVEPPVYSFVATPDENMPMTSDELQAILDQDPDVQLAFED